MNRAQLNPLPVDAPIPESRTLILQEIVDHIALQRTCGETADLIFICVHNSRRSHLAQIWATVAASHYQVHDVKCWSGGTEVTALNPRVVERLKRTGFIATDTGGDNPRYELAFDRGEGTVSCFSKMWNDASNPQEDIAAILVCDEAEKNCPWIPGALLRVGLPYVDPKESDGTDEEANTYDLRSKQIAEEMFWLFKQVAHEHR